MNHASRAREPAKAFPLMATGLGLTFLSVLGYKFFLGPYLAKKNREESQQFADSLIEMEEKKKSANSENGG